MTILGNAAAVGQIALGLLTTKPTRGFYTSDGSTSTTLVAQVTVEEVHQDETEITEHPVEQGAAISDHAFARPSEVVITAGWSNSPNNSGPINQLIGAAANSNNVVQTLIGAAKLVGGVINLLNGGTDAVTAAYNSLLVARQNRSLFDVYTGRRTYKGMLIKSLAITTDQKTENSMLIRITFRQILMAQTQTVTVPDSSVMANPAQNGATVNKGVQYPLPSPNINTAALPQFNSSGQQV